MGALTTAYVLVAPDMRTFGKDLKLGLRKVDVTSSGRDAGTRFSSGMQGSTRKAMGRGLAAAGVAAGAAFGAALTKGFGRLSAIENATAKLTGLGHSAKIVDRIMVNALASVKGTAFGLDEASTLAATAVASGIKPGKELERTLKLVADAATIGGTSLADMGAIFSQVAASNKVQGDTINQLNERGIPILKLLGDVMGRSQGEVAKLASKGKIDFATFQKAMEQGLGGAALKSGNTATGAFKNMGAAFSRVGAALLKGVFPQIGTGFGTITKALDAITPGALRFGEAFGSALTRVGGAFRATNPAMQQFSAFVQANVLPGLRQLGGFVTGTLLPAWLSWYRFLLSQLVPILRQVGGFIVTSVVPAFRVVARFIAAEVVPGFLSIVDTVKALIRVVAPIIGQLVGVILGRFREMSPEVKSIWTSVKDIITGVMFIVKDVIQAVTTIIRLIWDRWGEQIKTIVGTVFSTIFKVISGVMKAIAGVIKLAVALIKGDWKGAWEAIKQIFSGIWQAIKAILTVTMGQIIGFFRTRLADIKTRWTTFWGQVRGTASDAMTKVRTGIATALGRVRDGFAQGVKAIGGQWDKIKETAKKPIRFVVDTVLDNGILAAFRAISKLVGFDAGKNFHVSLPRGFARGTSQVLPGYTPGRDVHRFYSPTGGAIDLSGGEGIARPEIVRAVGKKRWDAANREAVHGRISKAIGYLGGYFLGGQAPVPGGVSGKHSRAAYPWARWAGDLRAGMGTPVRAWNSGRVAAVHHWGHSYGRHVRVNHPGNQQTLYAHMRDIIVRVGQAIGRGGLLGHADSTGNSTGPHLHFELKSGQGSLGGTGGGPAGIGIAAPLVDAAKYISQVGGAIDRLREISGTPFGKMIAGIPKMIVGAVKDKISSLADSVAGSSGPGVTGTWTGGSFRGLSASQMRIASTIADVGRSMGRKAQLIGIITGLVESRLTNVNFGDRDSLGVFQQRAPWGPASVRRNVAQSAHMFFHGGRGGQRGLDDIRGWQGMAPGRAAQAVQVSAFPGRYATQIPLGNAILGALSRGGLMHGGVVQGGRGGIITRVGEGRNDELVAPLPRNWKAAAAQPPSPARPLVIHLHQDGLTQVVQGILDEHEEFHASVGRMHR